MSKIKRAMSIIGLMNKKKPEYTAENPAPCPFCGAFDTMMVSETQSLMSDYEEFWSAECNVCNCNGPYTRGEDAAWKMWNKRGQMSPLCPQEH